MNRGVKTYTLHDTDLVIDNERNEYVLKVSDLPIEEKPREKLQDLGPTSLTTAELIAVLLGVGTKKEEVMSMSSRILSEYGEKAIITEQDPQKLADFLDIPVGKASQIIACFELGKRVYSKKEGKAQYIKNASQAYEHAANIGFSNKEQVRGLYLNSRYELIHDEVLAVGTLTASLIHPREVFEPALRYGAVAIIIAHNHPSGDLSPTEADMKVTKQLIASGEVIGIELIDHLIIAGENYKSILQDVKE